MHLALVKGRWEGYITTPIFNRSLIQVKYILVTYFTSVTDWLKAIVSSQSLLNVAWKMATNEGVAFLWARVLHLNEQVNIVMCEMCR